MDLVNQNIHKLFCDMCHLYFVGGLMILLMMLMEKIIHHQWCPKPMFYPMDKWVSGIRIPSGAGFSPLTVYVLYKLLSGRLFVIEVHCEIGWKGQRAWSVAREVEWRIFKWRCWRILRSEPCIKKNTQTNMMSWIEFSSCVSPRVIS